MIFLDANYLIALFIQKHENHKKAAEIYDKIEKEDLIITNSIILEVMTVSNTKLKVSKELLGKYMKT
jgi:predicted nucleic acid-binding protein